MLLRRPLTALLAAAASAAAELTTSITLGIQPSQQLANPNMLSAATHATLTTFRDSVLTAPLSTANTFVFHNVTAGSYLVDVHSPTHGFAPLRVDVIPLATGGETAAEKKLQVKAWETYRGNDWDNKGEEAATLTLGGSKIRAIEVRPLGQKVYFTERGSFSVMGILKNPMILMSLVSMVAFLGIPKLVENMDPEMKAEFEETQKSNPMGALMGGGGGQSGANPMESFDMAGFLSGHKKPESGGGSTTTTGGSASEGGGSRSGSSGGGKKRR